jgi:hypothetical protein
MSPELIPNQEQRVVLVNRIGRLASRTYIHAPDPELYAMIDISLPAGKIPLEQWCHVRNMAAVEFELVTNKEEATDEHTEILRAIEAHIEPHLTRLRSFKDGWHYRSPAFRAALQDVGIIQQKLYRRDRPSNKVLYS